MILEDSYNLQSGDCVKEQINSLSKYKVPSGNPYPSRKSKDNENTVEAVGEVESLLHCDKCTKLKKLNA